MLYSVWRACERFGILPPGLKYHWDSMCVESQTQLVAYGHIREQEELDQSARLMKGFIGG